MIRALILALLLSAFAAAVIPAPATAQGNPLVGLWKAEKRFPYGGGIVQVLGFAPDGRYAWVQDANGEKSSSIGRYQIQGSQIVFQEHYHKPEGGPYSIGAPHGAPLAADAALQGGTLVLHGPLFAALAPEGGGAPFVKEAGSEQAVVQSIRESDQQEQQSNATWQARIALAAMRAGAAGDPSLPADPAPSRVFPGATVFARGQVYAYIDVKREWSIPGDREGGRNTVRFCFFPNGRVCAKWVIYQGETGTARVQVSTTWGRYAVTGNGVKVESDKGEHLELAFADGRRNLTGMSTVLTQSEWLVEILQGRAK